MKKHFSLVILALALTTAVGHAQGAGGLGYWKGLVAAVVGSLTASDAGCIGWVDARFCRGAADRIDVETGDSLQVVSGGIGIGFVNTTPGTLIASGSLLGSSVAAGSGGALAWNTRSALFSDANGQMKMTTLNTTDGILSEQFTNNPTCATNCGTSPTLTGVDSSFTLTMGASGVPASGFVVTFNGTWPIAPQCVTVMGKAGMVVGKQVLTIVTTTTTATFVTNGTAPATTDIYHVRCSAGA